MYPNRNRAIARPCVRLQWLLRQLNFVLPLHGTQRLSDFSIKQNKRKKENDDVDHTSAPLGESEQWVAAHHWTHSLCDIYWQGVRGPALRLVAVFSTRFSLFLFICFRFFSLTSFWGKKNLLPAIGVIYLGGAVLYAAVY